MESNMAIITEDVPIEHCWANITNMQPSKKKKKKKKKARRSQSLTTDVPNQNINIRRSKTTLSSSQLEFDNPEEALRNAEYNLPSQSNWRNTYTHDAHDSVFTVVAVQDYQRPPKGKFSFQKGATILVSAQWPMPYDQVEPVATQSVRFRNGRLDVSFPMHPHGK